MANTLDCLSINGMSPISFEIMYDAVSRMDYYYGNRKHFDKRKQEALEWLEHAIGRMRDKNNRIPKRIENGRQES